MAEIDKADASIGAPTSSFSERGEGKVSRGDRGAGATHHHPLGRIIQFLHDVRAEMKRVSWPGLTSVQNTTIITIIAVIFFAVYLFAVDQALSRLILGLDWLIEKIARALGLA